MISVLYSPRFVQDAYHEPTLHNFDYVENRPDALAGSANGKWIACGSAGAEIALWRKRGLHARRIYRFRIDYPVVKVWVSDTGTVKAFCTTGTFRVLPNSKVVVLDRIKHRWPGFQNPLRHSHTTAYLPSDYESVAVSYNGHKWTFRSPGSRNPSCLVFAISNDGSRVGFGVGGRIWLFEAQTGKALSSAFTGDGVWAMAFCGRNTLLVATRPSELGFITDHDRSTK